MNIRGFRSEAELSDYLQANRIEEGTVVDAQTMYDLSKDWYRGRMDEDWEPPTPSEAEAVFARHGLDGDFWKMT